MKRIVLSLIFASLPLFAAVEPTAIPRAPTARFVTEGVFEGGRAPRANLEALRVADHSGFERWVVDFSDVKRRQSGSTAPKFQVRYVKADSKKPARFVLTLRGIEQQFLQRATLAKLVKRSRFVEEVVVYPPIEDGDIAIEMKLRQEVAFAAHQPIEREGRLVLDLKTAASPIAP